MPPQLDTIAGRYILESQISQGGMATVWRARDDVLARPVAIKILHPHLSEDEAFLGRFRREALAAARLTHPNIVAIYDTGAQSRSEGQPDLQFIVMELCGGGTLEDLLTANKRLAPERVASIGRTVCDALAYAHKQGIVHRDIKPGNVLVADDGLLKVGDFGIAKAAFAKSDITTTGSILGTVTYLSPEQSQGDEPDARSDIYGLGIMLYELTVGRPPFAGETQIATALMHVNDRPPPVRSIKAGVPRPLESTIMKALEKDPSDRFQSAEEMAAALQSFGLDAGPTLATPRVARRDIPAPQPAPRAGDTGWLVRVVAAITVTIALALFVASLVDDEDAGPTARGPGDTANQNGGGGTEAIEVASVTDFDPHGGDGEHPEEVENAVDGDESTAWTTSNYSASLELQGKPGVGLLFDLGEASEVERVSIVGSPGMDLELRVADEEGADENAFERVASQTDTGESFDLTFDATTGRHWLVWITKLSPEGGGRASLYEVAFSGG